MYIIIILYIYIKWNITINNKIRGNVGYVTCLWCAWCHARACCMANQGRHNIFLCVHTMAVKGFYCGRLLGRYFKGGDSSSGHTIICTGDSHLSESRFVSGVSIRSVLPMALVRGVK